MQENEKQITGDAAQDEPKTDTVCGANEKTLQKAVKKEKKSKRDPEKKYAMNPETKKRAIAVGVSACAVLLLLVGVLVIHTIRSRRPPRAG
jgi:hypothetical protein